MPPTPTTPPEPGEAPIRDRGDACPGALRLHAAADGLLARLRLPAGRLTPRQLMVLADAAESLGDGSLSVTSRGNAELRGLRDGCGAGLAALLADAGLLPSPTHERVRNIVASPAAGLDGLGHADVQLWARALDTALCAEPRAAALSGRFLFALDDGRGDTTALGADVTLIAAPNDAVLLTAGPETYRLTTPAPGTAPDATADGDSPAGTAAGTAARAARAALTCALAFLGAVEAAGSGAWRPRELPEAQLPDWARALARAGIGAELVPSFSPPPAALPPAPGPLGDHALHVLAPLGRLTAAQLRALGEGADEVRLTPWRGVVVVGPAADRLPALAAHGLVTGPADPRTGVTACTGTPGCAKSLADVRADAARAPGGPLPVHYSGCARRCGHPHGARIEVTALDPDTYLLDGAPVPRTALAEAVAAARTKPMES
ncbi:MULTISPECIES: cobalamin biosynthesis protein CobG [unclassified Streptomyces]|uniref:cobalamin biosynthesis protein CobG n=1 Tax=unclassified Streptomyces TaxID=2593676 RepID=UPI001F105C63|nr:MULTISPECIES: cobalamin biosynthesis protein CobG [unclassified Streptomyces]